MASAWERIIRGLGLLTVVLFLVVALTPATNIIGRRLAVAEAVHPSGAIVILGAGLIRNGILREDSMRRLVRGIELYKQGFAPLLVVLGAALPDESNQTEAEVRAGLARAMGVPPEAIIKVAAPRTIEESMRTANMLRSLNVNRIVLVTESLHMRRAQLVFEHAGLEVLPAVSTDYTAALVSPGGRLWLFMRIAQETAALIYYRLAGYI